MSAKFSRMATALSLNTENKSSYILSQADEIQPSISDRLFPPMKKVPIKEVLLRRMDEAGVNTPGLAARSKAKRVPVSETAIKSIRQGHTRDPQLSTVEGITAGLEISTLRFIAEVLGIDPDDPVLKGEDFRLAWEVYKDMSPSQQQQAKPFVSGLVVQLKHIKNQPK